jgi:hypothetical protein
VDDRASEEVEAEGRPSAACRHAALAAETAEELLSEASASESDADGSEQGRPAASAAQGSSEEAGSADDEQPGSGQDGEAGAGAEEEPRLSKQVSLSCLLLTCLRYRSQVAPGWQVEPPKLNGHCDRHGCVAASCC